MGRSLRRCWIKKTLLLNLIFMFHIILLSTLWPRIPFLKTFPLVIVNKLPCTYHRRDLFKQYIVVVVRAYSSFKPPFTSHKWPRGVSLSLHRFWCFVSKSDLFSVPPFVLFVSEVELEILLIRHTCFFRVSLSLSLFLCASLCKPCLYSYCFLY